MNARIKKSFNQAAASYDAHCHLQQSIGNKLLSLLALYPYESPRILDLGCGTGIVTEKLAAAYHYQALHAIDFADHLLEIAVSRFAATKITLQQADFDRLPNQPKSFDIIFSNMALHWSAHFQKTVGFITSQLKDHGLIAFTLPLIGTLQELTPHFKTNTFFKDDDIIQLLAHHDCDVIQSQQEVISLNFNDTLSALKSIKQVGANATAQPSSLFLRGKTFLNTIEIHKLTYHIGYFIARKKGASCQLNYLLPAQTQTPAKHTSAPDY